MMMDESSSMDKNEHTWMTRIDWTIQFLLLITKFWYTFSNLHWGWLKDVILNRDLFDWMPFHS
jgi:hypothetical protein